MVGESMRLRIASAVVLAPVALAAVYAGGWSTVALVAVAGVLATDDIPPRGCIRLVSLMITPVFMFCEQVRDSLVSLT